MPVKYWEIIANRLMKAGWSLMRTATTEGALLCVRTKS